MQFMWEEIGIKFGMEILTMLKKMMVGIFVLVFLCMGLASAHADKKYKKCPECGEINYKFYDDKDVNFCFKCGYDLRKMKYRLRSERMLIEEVLKRKVEDLGDPKKLSAAEWYQRGATSEDELTKMACFLVSLKVKENAGVHNNLGTIYQKKLMLEEAEKEYKKAIKVDGHYAIAHNNLSTVYLSMGKYKESLEEIQRALALDPGNAIFLKNKADVLCAMKKYKEAKRLYNQVLKKDKDSSASRTAAFKLDMIRELMKK